MAFTHVFILDSDKEFKVCRDKRMVVTFTVNPKTLPKSAVYRADPVTTRLINFMIDGMLQKGQAIVAEPSEVHFHVGTFLVIKNKTGTRQLIRNLMKSPDTHQGINRITKAG